MSETDPGLKVAQAIAAYAPVSLSAPAQVFAREVVTAAEPGTPHRAKALLFAATKLACFGERVGLELSAEALLDRSVIERFIVSERSFSPPTRRTLRTNLRALARALEAYPEPAPVALPRERAKAPYSGAEIDGYLRLACQPTAARRIRAGALICLGAGAGAGVVAGELRRVRGTDVCERSGGVIVLIGGGRARSVPVLARFRAPVLEAARFAGSGLIVGGREPGRRNVTDSLCAALSQDRSLPRLQPGRLRSTWLVSCARAIGLGAFMHAAGVRCSQRLGDIAAELPTLTEEDLVALLGGSA